MLVHLLRAEGVEDRVAAVSPTGREALQNAGHRLIVTLRHHFGTIVAGPYGARPRTEESHLEMFCRGTGLAETDLGKGRGTDLQEMVQQGICLVGKARAGKAQAGKARQGKALDRRETVAGVMDQAEMVRNFLERAGVEMGVSPVAQGNMAGNMAVPAGGTTAGTFLGQVLGTTVALEEEEILLGQADVTMEGWSATLVVAANRGVEGVNLGAATLGGNIRAVTIRRLRGSRLTLEMAAAGLNFLLATAMGGATGHPLGPLIAGGARPRRSSADAVAARRQARVTSVPLLAVAARPRLETRELGRWELGLTASGQGQPLALAVLAAASG